MANSATPAITDAANIAFAAAYSGADKDAAESDVSAHARYAAAEAVFVAGSSTAADYSVSAVGRAAAARADGIWERARDDARRLEAGQDLHDAPLWSTPAPEWFQRADAEMRAIWQQDGPEVWSFWLRWWDGVVSGKPLPWALQEKVATLIPDDVWEQGPEAVAEAIREIEGDEASRANREPTSLPRALERNRRAILLQLDALLEFVSNEIDRLRGPNSYSRREHGEQQQRIEKLSKIIEAVALMREAMDEEPNGSTALVVMDAQLPAVVKAADESVKLGGEPQVSEVIASMSITIKHLTDNGTPGNYATAMAFAELC